MKQVLIYSPWAYQKYGHSFDYSSGLSEALINLNYEVFVFGIDGPLKFPENVTEIRVNIANNISTKKTLLQKLTWGLKRTRNAFIIAKKFKDNYLGFQDKPIVIFETFEYFGLSNMINNFSGNYFCIFHDTNFNFKQTSNLAGIYKFLARVPAKKIIRHSRKSFVHGLQMKNNLINQLGEKYGKKVVEIPYGAPFPIKISEEDKIGYRSKLGLPKDTCFLLSFGTLRVDKEYLPIVKALKNSKNWHWIIAGPEGDYSYSEISSMCQKYGVTEKIITFPNFITKSEQKLFFGATDIVINLYKPFIRHESGTAQLARTFIRPVIVSGPPDLTSYVESENIGWVTDNEKTIEKILITYQKSNKKQKEAMKSNIMRLAVKNSWKSVVDIIISFN